MVNAESDTEERRRGQGLTSEERRALLELGISLEDLSGVMGDDDSQRRQGDGHDSASRSNKLHPALAVGIGVAFACNVAVILSLPPVLRGRGAPYFPTFRKSSDAMFAQLRRDPDFADKLARRGQGKGRSLTFVDLGSGDGRLVFRAAREGLFDRAVGCEINPLLHAFAQTRRALQPRYWSTTSFRRVDMWKLSLGGVDVVAVYGLQPIMKDLGVKLRDELKPGSFVLSNVFTIPGWRPAESSSSGTHIYKTPECWEDR